MENFIIVKFGEIALKGKNRYLFINRLVGNIKTALAGLGEFNLEKTQGRILLHTNISAELVGERLNRVFGINGYALAKQAEKDLVAIGDVAVNEAERMLGLVKAKTFKVESRRSDKGFPMQSPELSAAVGGIVLKNIPQLEVDVHHPDFTLNVEIREKAYIYGGHQRGPAGLPVGCSGKGIVLLSGGIDSPVAAWMCQKRGVEIVGLHFHSHPFTSERAREKVVDIGQELVKWQGRMHLLIVPFTEVQKRLFEMKRQEYMTLVMRRSMVRIANLIAEDFKAGALITGESIGQVASQTIESITVTDAEARYPVIRPVIGMDKEEITKVAQRIGTYEISIRPYEDCCTVFVPKHPSTKPRLEDVLEQEAPLVLNELEIVAARNCEKLWLSI
jgi:thiamine biosynthesis protein ThiI